LSAGSAGIVDATYYSSTTLQPNKPSSVWYVGLSQITGGVATYSSGAHAMYTSTPVATGEILLDPNPIHGDGTTGGGICTFGIFCSAVPGANRGLADVFEVHVDPAGGANVTWTKDLGGRRIFFACQNSGASAFAGAPDLNGCYGPADLSIAKSDSPDPVLQGQNLTYHLAVTNNGAPSGPSTTSGVKVTDSLPAEVSFVSATPSRGTCSGTSTITCSFGVLPGGAAAPVRNRRDRQRHASEERRLRDRDDLTGRVHREAEQAARHVQPGQHPERRERDDHHRGEADCEGDDLQHGEGERARGRSERQQQLGERDDHRAAL